MSKIATSPLGKNSPLVSTMGLGCMGLSAYYSVKPLPDEERFKVLDRATELGETLWVTSDTATFTRTGKRDEIFLVTKFGYEEAEALALPKLRSDPEFAKAASEKSLKRLGTDKINLYSAHRVDGKTPIEKTVEAMVELKKDLEYSPFALEIQSEQIDLLDTCRELRVAVTACSPLGRGFLTRRYRSPDDYQEGDARRYFARFNEENFSKNLALVDRLTSLAKKKDCSSAQLTLAWLMAPGEDIFPILGTTNVKNLNENSGASKIKLTKAGIFDIRNAIGEAEVYGARYPEGFIEETFRDTPPL
ncbi:hypothetical protein MMC15_007426 [Xylographa vitiligo]|nr:hypothetical protein [Xylographa vitiligo]